MFALGVALGMFLGAGLMAYLTVPVPRSDYCDPRAVTAAYREWSETGTVSPETMAWLEGGWR
jgi:hypothetical protein